MDNILNHWQLGLLDKPLLPQDIEAVDHEEVIDRSPKFYDDTYVQEAEEDNGERISAIVTLAQRPCRAKFSSE